MQQIRVKTLITQRLIDQDNRSALVMVNRQIESALRYAGCVPPYEYEWVYHPEPHEVCPNDGSHMIVYTSGKAPGVLNAIREVGYAADQS